MKKQLSTTGLLHMLAETSSLKEAVDNIDQGIDLLQYMNNLLNIAGVDIPTLARMMLASRPFAYQIFDGSRKPGRDMLIRMALVLQLSLSDTQRLLLLAQRGSLYPRIRRDAVIIFAIEHGYTLTQTDEALCSVCEQPLLNLMD